MKNTLTRMLFMVFVMTVALFVFAVAASAQSDDEQMVQLDEGDTNEPLLYKPPTYIDLQGDESYTTSIFYYGSDTQPSQYQSYSNLSGYLSVRYTGNGYFHIIAEFHWAQGSLNNLGWDAIGICVKNLTIDADSAVAYLEYSNYLGDGINTESSFLSQTVETLPMINNWSGIGSKMNINHGTAHSVALHIECDAHVANPNQNVIFDVTANYIHSDAFHSISNPLYDYFVMSNMGINKMFVSLSDTNARSYHHLHFPNMFEYRPMM